MDMRVWRSEGRQEITFKNKGKNKEGTEKKEGKEEGINEEISEKTKRFSHWLKERRVCFGILKNHLKRQNKTSSYIINHHVDA